MSLRKRITTADLSRTKRRYFFQDRHNLRPRNDYVGLPCPPRGLAITYYDYDTVSCSDIKIIIKSTLIGDKSQTLM